MSLLGKLFSGLPSATSPSQPSNPLDSNLEDHFTYNLLFPDPEALCHNEQVFPLSSGTVLLPANAGAFDINGDLDLEMRDVRVIIMQEATPISGSPYLFYDSHPAPPPSPSLDRQPSANSSAFHPRTEGRRSISSARKTSVGQSARPVVIQQESPAQPPRVLGAFDRRPTYNKGFSAAETEGQKYAREYREEVATFSNCIFGNSEVLAYKGTGTKVHILPSESRSCTGPSSYAGDGSLGRSSMRSSRLAQSFTSDNIGPGPTSAAFSGGSGSSARGADKKKVLVTRMFPVPLPNDDVEDLHSRASVPADATGYPFPKVGENAAPEKKAQPKQKRTPMYAVGLIIQLPSAPQAPSVPTSRSSFRAPGSYDAQESFPSSFNSARRAGWTMLSTGFGVESLESSSYYSDVDDRIDLITHHWDIIMRTLSHLQAVATATLLPMLKQADLSSPDPRGHIRAHSSSVSISGKRVSEEIKPFKLPKTNAKLVQLMQSCLMGSQTIHKEVDASRQRIVTGIKTVQVVTGQGRWGIWREEARLADKWAGGKEHGFFFYNLLTGFLGNHTEWLQALGPSWYRRRHYQLQRTHKDDDVSLPARTVIISNDKISARRLIFLLAAFLPANQQSSASRMHRPSTSTSFGGFSQSPPASDLREGSLRRRLNKRTGRTPQPRTMSFPVPSSQGGLGITVDTGHDRRPSDAISIKTANLPIPGSNIETRKSSTATTSTATPVTTMPHFVRRPVRGTGPAPRPGSSGSLATDDLLRSLKRGDSTGQYSNDSVDSQGQNSRWGNMISGLWGSKRRDSSATTTNTSTPIEGVEINDPYYKEPISQRSKLEEMVMEARQLEIPKSKLQLERELRQSESGSTETARADDEEQDEFPGVVQAAERVPDPTGAFESPVKTSITEDGVIDIDVPLPEYLSFDTAVSSPSSSGYLSNPGFANGMDGFEHHSRSGPEAETTLNVGGWLPRYHPDFALQAVPTNPDLIAEIKASMRSEPTPFLANTPHAEHGNADRWVDISSALVADTTNFTITHIRYMRLIKLKDNIDTATPSVTHSTESRYGNVYTAAQITPNPDLYDGHIEEKFVEEQLVSMDDTLIEAVERIIAQSGQASKNSSPCSSRSASRKGGAGRDRSNSDAKPHGTTGVFGNHLEVPRNECKKMVLSALEEIVREVAESRSIEEGEGHEQRKERGRGAFERESFLREGVRCWLGNVEGLE